MIPADSTAAQHTRRIDLAIGGMTLRVVCRAYREEAQQT